MTNAARPDTAPGAGPKTGANGPGPGPGPEAPVADPMEAGFRKGLVGSAALHAAVFAALAVRAVFYPAEPLQTERAIRVDIVDLPRKAQPAPPAETPAQSTPTVAPKPADKPPAPEAPSTPPPKAVAPAPEAPNKINLQRTKKSQADALKRLEALSRIEAQSKPAGTPAPPVRGAQLSAGQSLTGVAKLEFDGYLEKLDAHVKKNWALPDWLADAKLKAQIVVWMDARGNVTKKKLVRSSGNPVYDQRAMEAIERSSPFPAPPARLADAFAVDGVKLGFPE